MWLRKYWPLLTAAVLILAIVGAVVVGLGLAILLRQSSSSPPRPLGGSTRHVSVTVTDVDEYMVWRTHGARVCVGQVNVDPPSDQCGTTNDQGVAQVPLERLEPGSYGLIVFPPGGQSHAHWIRAGAGSGLYQVMVPEQGNPVPVTVTLDDYFGNPSPPPPAEGSAKSS